MYELMVANKGLLVETSGVLPLESVHELKKLLPEIQHTLNTNQIFRTDTEMRVSILNDSQYPTPDSKYWQAVREQAGMFDSLVGQAFSYRKTEVEIKILERDIANEEDDLKAELLRIELEQKRFGLLSESRQAQDRLRELHSWSKIKAENPPLFGDADPSLHQLISYTGRWLTMVASMDGGENAGERINIISQCAQGVKECMNAGVFNVIEQIVPQVLLNKAMTTLGYNKEEK